MPILFNPAKKKGIFMVPSGGTKSPTPPAPSWSSTKSLDFDGVDDYVDTNTTVAALNFPSTTTSSGAFSISFWYKFGSTTNWDAVIDNSISSVNGFGVWQDTTNDNLNFWVGHYSTSNVVGGSTLSIDTWYHITCVFVGGATHTLEIFINGVSDGTASYTAAKWIHTGKNVYIGTNYSKFRYIDATLDEFAIWDSDQSANVTSIYNSGTPNDLTSLSPTAWYRMGENSTFKTPQILMPENTNKDKFSNYSLDFDGVGDSITTGLDCSSATHPSITVSCWLKYPVEPPYHFGIYYAAGVQSANGFYQGLGLMNGGKIASKANGAWTWGTSLRDNLWHNVVWVCEYNTPSAGNLTMTVYLDGNATPDLSTIDTSGGQLIGDLFIGSYDGTSQYFDGNIDEVAVWNSALSPTDVAAVYGGGTPPDLTSLSPDAWYRMGEDATFSTNWTIPDQAGSNDGISANMTIEDRVGDAPGSENNSLSYNMDAADIDTDTPPN